MIDPMIDPVPELEVELPHAQIRAALRDGLREEAAPISRRLAEVKGLSNNAIRRLENLEATIESERGARIDDLALLVELLTRYHGTPTYSGPPGNGAGVRLGGTPALEARSARSSRAESIGLGRRSSRACSRHEASSSRPARISEWMRVS